MSTMSTTSIIATAKLKESVFTEPQIVNPGDGDSYYVFTRTLFGDECKRFNMRDGESLLFMQYGGTTVMMPMSPGKYLSSAYVCEKLDNKCTLRMQMAFYQFAVYLFDKEKDVIYLSSDADMSWSKDWREQLYETRNIIEAGDEWR